MKPHGRHSCHRQKAFSLVELTLVVVILGLAAATMTLNYGVGLRHSGLQDLGRQVASFDHLTRVQAREHDRSLRLLVNLGGGEIRRTEADGVTAAGTALEVPDGYRLDKLILGAQESTTGNIVIPCSRQGLTPTYALRLVTSAGESRWLVVAGLTGLVKETDDANEAKELVDTTVLPAGAASRAQSR